MFVALDDSVRGGGSNVDGIASFVLPVVGAGTAVGGTGAFFISFLYNSRSIKCLAVKAGLGKEQRQAKGDRTSHAAM